MSYAIYVGKNLSVEGHAFLAGYGDEPSSHWLEVAPRGTHEPGSTIEVGVSAQAEMPGVRSTIPQASETARHLRVSYSYYLGTPSPLTNGGLNEHGVAVRDVWSPSSARLQALTPVDQTGPNYSDLARLVLERARSAREGVQLIGDLIAEHGHSTYGGNSHLIADEHEGWVVIQFAGGRGLWVAERLGADSIRVSRPGYVLDVPPDFATHADFMGSPNLIEFAVENGWHDGEEPFNANAVYGDGRGRWPGVIWMEDALAERASRPEGISLSDAAWAVRAERLTGDRAGYGQIVPLRPEAHSDLRVLWHSPVGAVAAPFTPFVLGVQSIPPEFRQHRYLTAGEEARFVDGSNPDDHVSAVHQRVEATRSAVVTFKRLLYLLAEHHETFLPEVTPVWEALERELAAHLSTTLESAATLISAGRADLAKDLLTRFCTTEAVRSLDLGEAILNSIEARSRVLFGLREDGPWRGPAQLW
ncbi:MAG: dipeptidase [Gaiellales bacterium]|nr:dipeptidase [Gaiellales bacterium]